MKKIILFFIICSAGTEEQINMARSIGAQIRRADLQVEGQPEKCDYVAGQIPACYKNKPIFETAKEMSEFLEGKGPSEDGDGGSGVDGEVTIEKLEALTKSNLLAYAEENEIELTKEDKKNKGTLVEAIAEHLGID